MGLPVFLAIKVAEQDENQVHIKYFSFEEVLSQLQFKIGRQNHPLSL